MLSGLDALLAEAFGVGCLPLSAGENCCHSFRAGSAFFAQFGAAFLKKREKA
jgi:hypothetical protein